MFSLNTLCALAAVTFLTCAAHNNQSHPAFSYSTVTGYFLQDLNTTNATTFDFRATNFGLINRTYSSTTNPGGQTQWQLFTHHLTHLRSTAPPNVHYTLLFLGRHGEGYHNAAESFYGTPAWNCYYSILNGNDTVTWSDAELTPTGTTQALTNHDYWKSEIEEAKVPQPEKLYVSPLRRCLQTAFLTFGGLDLEYPFVPVVKEGLREGISGHTCDRRGSRQEIGEAFPGVVFEEGFSEKDELWEPLHGETTVDQTERSRRVLNEIFAAESGGGNGVVSITSHSGEIASILGVLRHRPFPLSTGAIIPVLVRAERLQQEPPAASTEPYTGICTCTSPPAKSATSSECATATATVAPPGGGSGGS